jgi:hypothetical protein
METTEECLIMQSRSDRYAQNTNLARSAPKLFEEEKAREIFYGLKNASIRKISIQRDPLMRGRDILIDKTRFGSKNRKSSRFLQNSTESSSHRPNTTQSVRFSIKKQGA